LLVKEGGGDVLALASSLHMLEDVEFRMFRLKARPWNAAVFCPGVILAEPWIAWCLRFSARVV
jgi:hypothetical protein